MRGAPRRLLAPALALALLAAAGREGGAQMGAPDPNEATPGQDICPAIAEGFMLCSSDPWSGNCEQFVAAAGRLAELYQIQAADTPERVPQLLSTNWWGCGDAPLPEMKALLIRIGTPEAQRMLEQQPFARIAVPGAGGPPQGRTPAVEPDCENAPTPDARDACAVQEVAAARNAYQHALAACRGAVAPLLRESFEGDETAWEQALPAQCDAAALEYQDPRLQGFAHSQCLARALRERTQGMLAAHPECRPGP